MATYGPSVTGIDQRVVRINSNGTTTGTLVVPPNAEAEIFIQCFSSNANATTVTSKVSAPVTGTIIAVNASSGQNTTGTLNVVLGPGTYTIEAVISGGVFINPSSAEIRINGSLRAY